MPRSARSAPGGVVFHCLNRGNDRGEVFCKDGDYAEKVLAEVLKLVPMRLLAYCLMSNHSPLSLPKGGTWCCGRSRTATWAGSCIG